MMNFLYKFRDWVVVVWKLLLYRIISRIPIVGGILFTTCRHHREAIQEIIISFSISAAPLYVGALILFINAAYDNPNNIPSIGDCFFKVIKNGELFIYSASTLAPVMYIVTRERSEERAFPSKFSFMFIVILFSVISTAIFTVGRVKNINFPDMMTNISICFFIFSLVVFYFVLVYNNTFLPDPPQAMRQGEEEYLKRVRERRG